MHRDPRETVLKITLGVLCAYHLGVGLISCLAPGTTLWFASWFYGVHVHEAAAQVIYMLKALGMYALFTGALLALALRDPRRYRHVVLAAAGLLVMRATTRLLFFPTLEEAFEVTWGRNAINVGLLLVQAAALLWGAGAFDAAPAADAPDLDRPVRPARRPQPSATGSVSLDAVRAVSRRLRPDPALASASGIR